MIDPKNLSNEGKDNTYAYKKFYIIFIFMFKKIFLS